MPNDEEQALQWKKKYFASLEKLEKVEQQSADTEALLRRSLSRISLALDGFDSPLDKQLDALRSSIRSGRKPLYIGQLSEEISTRGQAVSQQRQSQPKNPQLLLSLLEKLTLPSTLHKQKTILRKELSHKHADQQIETHIDTLALLLRAAQNTGETNTETQEVTPPPAATTTPASKGAEPEGGFLSRLFASGEKQRKEDIKPQTNTQPLRQLLDQVSLPSPYAEQLEEINAKFNSSTNQADLNHLVSKLADLLSKLAEMHDQPDTTDSEVGPPGETAEGVLLQLLDRITLVDPYAQELEQLRETILTTEKNQLDFSQILESLARLISHAQSLSQSEKQALEGFLLNITDTLDQIDSNIRGTRGHQNQLRQSGEKLDNAVKTEVSDMQTSVLEMNDLAELKQCIQSRLSTINQHLDTFKKENETRYEQMEHAMESMVNQVIKVESESNNLQKALEEQRNKATKDPLTGVSNRLAYEEFIQTEYSRWQRFQHSLTMVIWDIDHFKSVNDSFGHQAGDKALTIVAQLLNKRLRKVDYFARFGGEEFVSLLPETEIEPALMVANKLREIIAKTEFHFNDKTVPLTISCGLAQFREGDTPDTVFQRADAALYQAKEAGRNCCKKEGETDKPALGGHTDRAGQKTE